jgi:amidase
VPTEPVDLETVTVEQLLSLLDGGHLTSAGLVRACLDRIAALDATGPSVGAIRAVNPAVHAEARAADEARARGVAGRPLLGLPVLVKDNIDVEGMPTTAGSVVLAASYPAGDAALVTGLRAAGAVVLGKTNLTEFANFLAEGMPSGYSSLGGQVLNPYDTSVSPSGSSSGSAVAAAIGFAPLTVGTETSGSILSPSAATSVVGVKPTVGLVSRRGVVPIAASQDTAGPMARTVADAAVLLGALAAVDPGDPATLRNPLADHDFTLDLRADALRGARIGVVRDQVPPDTADERALWDAAVTVLRRQGATLVPVDLDTEEGFDSTVLHYEFKRDLDVYLAGLPDGAPVRSLAEVLARNEADAQAALKFGQARAAASQAMDLSPGSADTARYAAHRARDLADSRDRLDEVMARHDVGALLFAGSGGSSIGAKAGYPSVSVPAGYRAANRRPFAVCFLGTAWAEPALVGYAHAYEQASGVWRPPSVVNPALFRRLS